LRPDFFAAILPTDCSDFFPIIRDVRPEAGEVAALGVRRRLFRACRNRQSEPPRAGCYAAGREPLPVLFHGGRSGPNTVIQVVPRRTGDRVALPECSEWISDDGVLADTSPRRTRCPPRLSTR
jgi:hypothetical protein